MTSLSLVCSQVNVVVVELSPVFAHETVPSKSPYAFLKANVTNGSLYPLLAGPANVFLYPYQ